MKQLYLLSICFLILFFSGCGDSSTSSDSKKTKALQQGNSEPSSHSSDESTDLVDADEFSKAFSNNVYVSEEQTDKDVIDDGSDFFQSGKLVQNKFTNQDFQENVPPTSSLAGSLQNSLRYSWLPHWDFSGRGGAQLPDAALSSDKSLLAILENVSPRQGKLSTLLVLINTYNFQINSVYYFYGKQFTKVAFVPTCSELVVWEQEQGEDVESGLLHLIDLKNGEIRDSSKEVKASSANLAVSSDGEFVILKPLNGSQKLFLFSVDKMSEMPAPIQCNQTSGVVAVTEGSEYFCLIGKDEVEIFKFSDRSKLKDIKLDLQEVPDDAICIGSDKFAMLSYRAPLVVALDDGPKKICDLAGRKLCFRDDNQTIIFEEYKNRAVSIADLKSLEIIDSFIPEKLKPVTKGGALLLAYLPHIDRYMLLDTQGNLSLFYRPGRRWRKQLIFTAEK